MGTMLLMLTKSFLAGIASVGFAILFNVPQKTLLFCAFTSFIGYLVHLYLLYVNLSSVVSTFFAALAIGLLSTIWSIRLSVPRPAFTVASIIPMFPGKYAYLTVMTMLEMTSVGVSNELTALFIQNLLTVISIISAIALGLSIPSLYFIRHNRPVI